ncbi:hypothetical protein [Sodalis-like endosymbiont of Proechinophthirus fluctus]|nr:hypothetical protein [Sodalis-like endosymbiont of Proechinophthirus fluctus]
MSNPGQVMSRTLIVDSLAGLGYEFR